MRVLTPSFASSLVLQMRTPFPKARPSAFKTIGTGAVSRYLRAASGEMCIRDSSYYPKRMEFLLKENLLGSTYEFFHNHGLIPTHSVKTVEICYATPEEAQRLGVPEKHALLLQKDEVFDQDDEVLHYSKLLTNPQRYRLTIVT